MKNFKDKLFLAVKTIPKGKVMSYGAVAASLGKPRSARAVGWTLHTLDGTEAIPWWRVVNAAGYLSIRGNTVSSKSLQKKFLEKEGVIVSNDFKLDMEKYSFQPARGRI